jgi:hypothetical protein
VSDVDAYLRTYGFSVKLPGRRLIAEEGDIAIVSVDLAVEPAMNDDTILRPTLLKAVISNGAFQAAVMDHACWSSVTRCLLFSVGELIVASGDAAKLFEPTQKAFSGHD